uniref:ARAD1C33440p n=1 Tax=Blastobotrys adeninivorans TaxID=409370 RepID=A0A060T8Y6_BLAAD
MDQSLLDRIVLIGTQPDQPRSVLCPALSIVGLAALESRNHKFLPREQCPDVVRAMEDEPRFIPAVVAILGSSNHVQSVQVALQVINSLLVGLFLVPNARNHIFCSIREAEVFRAASTLLENKQVSSHCRAQLYDLQQVIKACLRKVREIEFNPELEYHHFTYRHTEKHMRSFVGVVENTDQIDWEKAGVPADMEPSDLINGSTARWAGMLDMNDVFAEDRMKFRKVFLEQVAFSKPQSRFPFLKASMASTCILYDIFGIHQDTCPEELITGMSPTLQPPDYIDPGSGFSFSSNSPDPSLRMAPGTPGSTTSSTVSSFNSPGTPRTPSHQNLGRLMSTMDSLRPLFFDWATLHFAGITNFMRIWQASCAEQDDFDNVKEVVHILFDKATQHAISASSSSAIENVLSKLDTISYDELRGLQLKAVEGKLQDRWGDEIRHLHRGYLQEAQDFVREQRIRLLLLGDWFLAEDPTGASPGGPRAPSRTPSRGNVNQSQQKASPRVYFIALTPSRKTLQYAQFAQKSEHSPAPEMLSRSIDLTTVSKVVLTPLTHAVPQHPTGLKRVALASRTNYTKISLISSSGSRDGAGAALTFYSDTPEKASAWGDGLLMLKNKAYQSVDTKKYIEMFADTKLRIHMLTLVPDDLKSEKVATTEDDFDRSEISTDFYYK